MLIDGVVSVFAGRGSNCNPQETYYHHNLGRPFGIAVDQRNGDVFVSECDTHVIKKITQTGKIIVVAGRSGQGGFVDGQATKTRFLKPYGIALWEQEEVLFVADAGNHRIRKINIQNGTRNRKFRVRLYNYFL